MNIVFRYEEISLPLALAALVAILGAGCASTQTAAPVIERSTNPSRTATAAATPAASTTTAPAVSTPQAAAPPQAPAPPQAGAPPKTGAATASTAQKIEAPVSAATEEPIVKPYREGDWRPEFHIVRKGDTLYSIALDYGQDYRELAAWNNLEDPALIRLDQRLRLFPPDSVREPAIPQAVPLPVEIPPAPVTVPVKTEPKARKLPYSEQALAQLKAATPKPTSPPITAPPPPPTAGPPAKPAVRAPTTPAAKEPGSAEVRLVWEWPTQGKLIYGFGEGTNQKGVGIEGRSGQAVLAGAPGKVVYSGSGLRGYGKLVIIKHNATYLSVYAHNSQILVKEGQSVAKGQKIAEMGNSDSDRVALHFEIRRFGKPIDPLQYLPERNS